MPSIKQNITQITAEITNAAKKYNRNPQEIQLLAVSKTKPISAINDAINCEIQQFGENYAQEGAEKVIHFRTLHPQLKWHFIGPIQSNKTRLIAEHFDWVHSVDRLKIAQRLNDQRPAHMPPLQVLIQINSSEENTKSGVSLAEVTALAEQISALPNIALRGLMCIPKPSHEFNAQLASFAPMQQLFEKMRPLYPHFDTLSMGMSEDLTAAIASGSTMVRVGSAIFGARAKTGG